MTAVQALGIASIAQLVRGIEQAIVWLRVALGIALGCSASREDTDLLGNCWHLIGPATAHRA